MTHPLTPLLQARELSFGWPGQPLLHDLNVDILPGLTVVRGDEGCGKTTLLRLLAGEWTPQAGSLRHLELGQGFTRIQRKRHLIGYRDTASIYSKDRNRSWCSGNSKRYWHISSK